MSAPTPPRLLDLAGRHLLRAEDLDVSTLESVPTELFPPLFLEAFDGYRTETLKAMVQTWPFVRLPLGALIDLPHVGPLQAVLEALDVLLAQKVRSRRCKLRVLDLRKTGQNFWSMWSGASSYGCSGSRTAAVAEPRSMTRQPSTPLKVFLDLCLKKRTLDNFLTYFLRWVEQRKSSIHLCCKKLKIVSMPMDKIVKVLSTVQLDCIQEVQVSCTWSLSTLATLAPFLGEMSNLQRLHLSHVHVSAFKKQELISVFVATFCLSAVCNLAPGSQELIAWFLPRCLRSPLDSLSITKCRLTESDLTHVSQSPDISQLKSLDLSGVPMTDFRPELLQVLLEKVAATLQEVDLDACGITDSQLEAFLPALSRCSQLRAVSLCGNLLSTAVLEKLLRHTAVLPCLRQERYPAPQESYRPRGVLLEARLARLRAQLLEILRDLGRPRIIWISLSPCPRCGEDVFTPGEKVVRKLLGNRV
uniref:Uncharacterized protein n=1 Tax=Bos indicus x Bos taurus TaxID=30522 RepID=A0A4W2H212_BOBOX